MKASINILLKFTFLLIIIGSFTSCVGKKKFLAMQTKYESAEAKANKQKEACLAEKADLKAELQETQKELAITKTKLESKKELLSDKENDLMAYESQLKVLKEQLAYFKSSNTSLLERLSDLAVVSKSGAENIKKSLETLGEQNRYIRDLTTKMQKKDSLNLALVTNLKRSLQDVNDEDVQVEVKKGVVYISLSDKMLFKTGSSKINPRASEVLGKVAKVLNDHNEIDLLVEGHTDSVPISKECIKDNWDLSTQRATAVVRVLQKQHDVDPARMTAGGRSKYAPKTTNKTEEGRATNRRTEIVILPKLDQFFQLLTPADEKAADDKEK